VNLDLLAAANDRTGRTRTATGSGADAP